MTLVLVSALAVSGCSFPLFSLTGTDDADATATGSIAPSDGRNVRVADASQPADDLAYARAAAENVLAHGAKDASVPWQNPQTGAGGNITPLDTVYNAGGEPCRDFLASYMHGASQEWLQGAACRDGRGVWQIKRLKPLKPS